MTLLEEVENQEPGIRQEAIARARRCVKAKGLEKIEKIEDQANTTAAIICIVLLVTALVLIYWR